MTTQYLGKTVAPDSLTAATALASTDSVVTVQASEVKRRTVSDLVADLGGEDWTVSGSWNYTANVGFGTATPQRAIHVKNSQAAVFLEDSDATDSFSIITHDSGGQSLICDIRHQTGAGIFTVRGWNGAAFANLFRVGSGGDITNLATYNATTASAANMFVTSGGAFQRSTSSGAYKTDYQTIDPALSLSLTPRSFKSQHPEDWGRRFAGFIAEEVAAVMPEASVDDGENYDVRAIVAALVATVKDLETRIAALEAA